MEENKKKTMGVASEEATQKLTYEQLNDACSQLYQQNQKLYQQLKDANMNNMFRRLDYLFMVLQFEQVIKDPEFINSCVDEIKEAMYLPKKETATNGGE